MSTFDHKVRLAVKGLTASERQLLDGLVRLGERDTRNRLMRIGLLADGGEQEADVALIDAADAPSMGWARQQAWLAQKPVIWIDSPVSVPHGHTQARRPMNWSLLPVLLTKAIEARQPRVRPAEVPRTAGNRRPKLLIVDDSNIARTQLKSLLAMRNCEAVESGGVSEALARVETEHFDCVFMDVLMPGIDGYDGCRQVKALRRGQQEMPVVMLTSKTSPFDRIRGKMAGCNAYLGKPVDARELDAVLAQFAPGARAVSLPQVTTPPLGSILALPSAG